MECLNKLCQWPSTVHIASFVEPNTPSWTTAAVGVTPWPCLVVGRSSSHIALDWTLDSVSLRRSIPFHYQTKWIQIYSSYRTLCSTPLPQILLSCCTVTNNSNAGDVIYHKFYAAPYRQPKCNLTGDSFAKPHETCYWTAAISQPSTSTKWMWGCLPNIDYWKYISLSLSHCTILDKDMNTTREAQEPASMLSELSGAPSYTPYLLYNRYRDRKGWTYS